MPAYYPPVGFHFKVEFSGLGSGDNDTRFQEVAGMTAEITTEELQVGGEKKLTHRLPTRAKYGNLILKRGMLQDSELISWFTKAIEDFEFKPTDVSVYLLDENHEIASSWIFIKAYPDTCALSDFKAQDNSLVIETIELVYQYFRRK